MDLDVGAIARGLGVGAAAVLAAEYLPSVAVLGQWTPLRSAPAGLCRWRGPAAAAAPAAALTFDDGPHPEGTPAVLDRLDELGLRATFFPLGSAVERHPDLLAEVVRRGHEVGTHGYRHAHHLLRSPAWVARDLRQAAAVMAGAGTAPTWFRPPYGQATAASFVVARRRGWRPVLWSTWGREWSTTDHRAVAARIGHGLRPGGVVLLHDSDAHGRPGMWRTALDALPLVAAELDRRGLRPVTLAQLFR